MKHKGPKSFMEFREKQIISALPQEKQSLAKETFAKLYAIREENFKNSKGELLEIEKIVIAEKFDEKLFVIKMQNFRKSQDEGKAICNQEIAKFLSQLNQNEREKLVEQFKKTMKEFRR